MSIKSKLIRKIIPLMAITASTGSLSAALLKLADSDAGLWGLLIISFVYIIAGTLAGFIYSEIFARKGRDILTRNVKGDPFIVKQPAYLISSIAIILALITNWKEGIAFAILASLLLGFNFLMGVSNGIFDYRESVTKNTLYTGIIPIGFLLINGYYIDGSEQAMQLAWLAGSLYLYTYLLFINRMQLDSIIFFRKSVNIEDSKKIRAKNDIMITIYYCVYLVLFNFRKMITITREAIEKFISWFFMFLEKISDWLIADIPFMERQPIDQVEELGDGEEIIHRPWLQQFLKIVMYTLLVAICIAAVVAIIGFIVKLVKKIKESMRLNYNRKASEKRSSSEEYVEESEIVKEERNNSILKSNKKKLMYNLRELGKIPIASDKIRYLYGFVLERLHHRHISIENSDTPEEILEKIQKANNGNKLTKMGFSEFTQNYERVRYGQKDVELEDDLVTKGADFEKAVSSMSEDKSDTGKPL